MTNNMIHIYLEVTYLDSYLELNVSTDCNFKLLFAMLKKMKKISFLEEQYIYEKETMVLCDQDVSFDRLNVKEGSTFLVI